jgi:hypothetical protein
MAKMLKIIAAVLSLSFWTASCILWYHYSATRPSAPDPAQGRIYGERQIGDVFYLTSKELIVWRALAISGVVFFIATAGLYLLEKRALGQPAKGNVNCQKIGK